MNEIIAIEKKFYSNFVDYFIETLKAFTITQKELQKNITYSNFEIFEQIQSENKNVIMMLGHIFNWEWFIGIAPILPFENKFAVFKPIKNKFWNKKIRYLRERFSAKAISAKDIIMTMMRSENKNDTIYFFVADQSPKKSNVHYYLNFLNQKTPIFIGFDKVIRKKELGVVYCNIIKLKRGKYHIEFRRLLPKNKQFEEYEMAHLFFHELENTIYKNPDNWLWSHKRWKY